MKFNAIYMHTVCNLQSVANETDIIANARAIYQARYNKPFANESFWLVVHKKSKWLCLKSANDFTRAISRKNKSSETNHSQSFYVHIPFDLNNAYPYEVPPRHIGRDKAKYNIKSVSSSSDVDAADKQLQIWDTKIEKIMERDEIKQKTKTLNLFLQYDMKLSKPTRRIL